VLRLLFGLIAMPPSDGLYFNLDCFVNMYAVTSKIDSISSIMDQVKRNGRELWMFRCKIIKVLGTFYLKEMGREEFKRHWHQCFVEVQEDVQDES